MKVTMIQEVRSQTRSLYEAVLAAVAWLRPVQKKPRCRPPWWCRAALAAAVWPSPELYDYARRLHREYLRRLRRGGTKEADKYARREAMNWAWATGWRVFRAVMVTRIARS